MMVIYIYILEDKQQRQLKQDIMVVAMGIIIKVLSDVLMVVVVPQILD